MKKVMKWTGIVILAIVLIAGVWVMWNLRDRQRGYEVNMDVKGGAPVLMKAGFSAQPITPEIVDTWEDVDHNAKYEPDKGDIYHDNNHNGRFDAYWIAGFDNRRAANGVHDNVWARAMVLDDGKTRLAVVALDAIGFTHDDIVEARKMIPAEDSIDYAIILSTHDHESYDLLGLWGESMFRNGVNPEMRKYVKQQIVATVTEAVKRLRPAYFVLAQDPAGAASLHMDTRDPIVMDSGLRIMRAVDAQADTTLGTVLSWGNHAETLWSDNLLITSDFPHYWRKYVEEGVYDGDTLVKKGIGGTALFIPGAVGGLMTTRGSEPVKDPFRDTVWVKPTFEKACAEGQTLALLTLDALAQGDTVKKASLSLVAQTIKLPVDNKLFRLGASLGVLDIGMAGWFKKRSEVAAFTLGPATFLAVPGEIYPEIVNGGVEAPQGQDFDIKPIETPPLRELMPGKYKFVMGLANDEIGYIIPKSQWDEKAPYTYGRNKAPYGEENSLGPETAPQLYKAFTGILKELKER